MDLSEFFEQKYIPARLFGKSGNSVRTYRITINQFSQYLGRKAQLSDLNQERIQGFMQARISGLFSGRSKSTANKDRSQLVAIWNYAFDKKALDDKPEVSAYIEAERIPKAWLREDLERLFASIAKQDGDFCGIPKGLWWSSLVMLALETGERIGALFAAEWGWLEGQWIQFPAEVRKGGKRDRKYWITPKTCGLLNRIRQCKSPGSRIFAWPYSSGYLWQSYRKILVNAKLPHAREDKFHRLRKTHASVIHQAGMDATESLDHQSRRTTKRYIDERFSTNSKPSQALADFLAQPGKRQQAEKAIRPVDRRQFG